MPFPRFVTFKEGDHIYMLQTAFPHYLAKIHRCMTDYELFRIKREVKCDIPGYRMTLTFEGTLEGNLVFVGDRPQQFRNLINEMASFYLLRIQNDPKRYDKWKISSAPLNT